MEGEHTGSALSLCSCTGEGLQTVLQDYQDGSTLFFGGKTGFMGPGIAVIMKTSSMPSRNPAVNN